MKSTGGFDRYFFRAFNTMEKRHPLAIKCYQKHEKNLSVGQRKRVEKRLYLMILFDIRLKERNKLLRRSVSERTFPLRPSLKAKSSSRTWEGFDLRQ